MVKAKVKP